jgi:hypothetical protein
MNLKFWYSHAHRKHLDMKTPVGIELIRCTALIDGNKQEYTATSRIEENTPYGVDSKQFPDYQFIGIGPKSSIRVRKGYE